MKYFDFVITVILLCASRQGAPKGAWEIPKTEMKRLVAMATCKTVGCVDATYAKIAKPETLARIVYYSGLLRLRPGDRTASLGLLSNIPKENEDQSRLSLLPVSYVGETTAENVAIAQTYWDYSKNLARALKLFPRFLPAFIGYGRLAIRDHHDNYPNWAARVCRSNPNRFLEAFETLSPEDRHYVAKYVIQPSGCKQIAFPEAD
jgi:hypothetical protein